MQNGWTYFLNLKNQSMQGPEFILMTKPHKNKWLYTRVHGIANNADKNYKSSHKFVLATVLLFPRGGK